MTDLQLKGNCHLIPWSNIGTSRLTLKEQHIFIFEERHVQKTCVTTSKGHAPIVWISQLKSIKHRLVLLHTNDFSYYIYQQLWINHQSMILFHLQPAPWMLCNTFCMRIFYIEMAQSQHCTSRQKILTHMSSVMPYIKYTQPSSVVTMHNKYKIYLKNYSSVALWCI